MVGVPGRSKACHTCRQRRIACSLQRPQCEQCIKSNRPCGGYQRDRIFVVGLANSYQAKKKLSRQPSANGKMDFTRNQQPNDFDRTTKPSSPELKPSTKDLPDLSNSLIPHTAFRQQLLSKFIDGYIPITRLGANGQNSWLHMLPELPTLTKALEISIMAVCTARWGREIDNLALIKESLNLYTQGLRQLQIALCDSELRYKDETLGACMALAMYEVMECPSDSRHAYVTHQQGCARLVQVRGPEAHSSGLGHQIFLSFRIHSVIEALKYHRSTYLTEPTWIEKPWANEQKRPFDRLFDYFALAPELFKQGDQLGKIDPFNSLKMTINIINRCFEVDAGLERFLQEFVASSPQPLFWPEFSQMSYGIDDEDDGKVFPVAFQFTDLRTANTMMYYWSTLLMLWSGLCQLYRHISNLSLQGVNPERLYSLEPGNGTVLYEKDPHQSVTDRIPPLSHRTDFATIAWNICQSVEYCMQDEMLGIGPQSVAVPLQIVVEIMKENPIYSRQVIWAKSVLENVREKGIRILKFA